MDWPGFQRTAKTSLRVGGRLSLFCSAWCLTVPGIARFRGQATCAHLDESAICVSEKLRLAQYQIRLPWQVAEISNSGPESVIILLSHYSIELGSGIPGDVACDNKRLTDEQKAVGQSAPWLHGTASASHQ